MKQEAFKTSAEFIAKRNVSDRVLRVIVSFDRREAHLKVIYHLRCDPEESDYEDCELTCAELVAEFPEIKVAETRCVSDAVCGNDIGDIGEVVFSCEK